MPRAFIDSAVCPACASKGMEYNAEQIDLPYLGDSLETMLRCPACGYRHTDFVLTETKEAMRDEYVIQEADDMSVRVVRSSSGTLRIPELGVLIEPGIASEAFISNVEGVFVRVERVLDQLHRDSESAQQKQRIEALLARFQQLRDGKGGEVTLVIEDPFGNSAILHDDAIRIKLDEEEAARLQTGMVVIDQDEAVTDAEE